MIEKHIINFKIEGKNPVLILTALVLGFLLHAEEFATHYATHVLRKYRNTLKIPWYHHPAQLKGYALL